MTDFTASDAHPGSASVLPLYRRYDWQAIAKHYRWRPLVVLWRTLTVSWMLGTFALGLLFDNFLNKSEANQDRRAVQLRKILTQLGPTFIKVGQALSTRPEDRKSVV